MKKIAILVSLFIAGHCMAQPMFSIDKTVLQDKIRGGWAGQTIGVTFGAPVEFRYNGTLINDYHHLQWYDGLLKKSMIEGPGIYDDLYMDLTFVEVFEKEGLDAPVSSHANAFANAGYMLWHANQAARYNILHGIAAPASGYWLNNPHADCIDFQIESDFAGLMSPGLPNTATAIADKIGHIMNYGDGWYGGVYVSAMYSLAFISKDINYVVNEALKTIPAKTKYHDCIADVIAWHKKYPNDWKQTWFEIQKKWTDDIGCPGGVLGPFNIDAKVNSAYVVLGLLYGKGDFSKTMEITARCGQDADCNPSTAGGILGTMLGYNGIPAYWKQGLAAIEDMDFKYTTTSLNKVYNIGNRQALENISRNGGRVDGNRVIIKTQLPLPVKYEQSFTGIYPLEKKWIGITLSDTASFSFTGNAFVILGENQPATGNIWNTESDKVAKVEMYIDGQLTETFDLPVKANNRRHEICWKYQLPETKHTIQLKLLNPDPDMRCNLGELLVYSGKASTH